jgi:hypothetical protein
VIDEYRSATRFTALLGDLLEIEAPFEVLAAVHRLVGHEGKLAPNLTPPSRR